MSLINPVGTPIDPDFETQTPTEYKTNIDNSIVVGKRLGQWFACHENEVGSPPAADMSVIVEGGFIWNGNTLTEVASQIVGDQSGEIISAPSGNPRIDRIVLDKITGVASRVTGVEDASPVAPNVPDGKMPCAQILLDNSPATSSITNQIIYDERVFPDIISSTFSAVLDGDQVVSTSVAVKIQFNSEYFDTNGDYDSVTNYRFTPTIKGKYLITISIGVSGYTIDEIFTGKLYKNGVQHRVAHITSRSTSTFVGITAIVEANGTTDYFEVYADSVSDSSYTLVGINDFTRFEGLWIAP
ncbi:hypothetical protein LCGC14_1302200 [marine sediment metagenome]|uniref:C1q domain-containing protein n=1 Tax=marine sediment metagenome TaxID=412755 RepID=A0A0F9N5V1_9ZZZZ